MKIWWFSLIFLLSFVKHVPINGDTYHYQVVRKICPSGTYHDPIKDKCRIVPGGGEMIKINLDARCSGGFLGLLAHSKKSRFYYVCKKDSVLTCMCKPTECFNRIRLKCQDKSNKKEGLTHEVVDHIVDKYKCSIMNGVYEEDHCELPGYGTTDYPQVTGRSIEEFDRNKITQLQNILRYLTFIRTIHDRPQSFESIETTSTPVRPPTIIIPIQNLPTTETMLRFTAPPEDSEIIEKDINDFKRNWDVTTSGTTVAEITTNTNVRPRFLKNTTSNNNETTTDAETDVSETTNAIKTRVSDETTTIINMMTTEVENTTLATTESLNLSSDATNVTEITTVTESTSAIETTSATETTLKGRDISSGTISENELTTQESDALAQRDDTSTVESVDETTVGKLVTRIGIRTTTQSIDGTVDNKKVDDDEEEEDELEQYFEYYYENEPDKVLWKTNHTKLKVTGKNMDDDEDDENWRKVVTFTEANDEVTLPDDETTESPVPIDETTVGLEETTALAAADELRKISIDTTTENFEDTTSTTTEILTTMSFELDETSSQLPPEPLIKKYAGDLTYNDFDLLDFPSTRFDESTTEFTETTTITLPSTTMTFDGITPPSTRMYKFSTTISPEITTILDSTTTENADDQTTTDNIKGRWLDSFEISAESTTLEFDSLELEHFTTQNPTTTEISISTLEGQDTTTEIGDSTSTTESLAMDGSTMGQLGKNEDSITVLTTTDLTTDFSTFQPESSTILDTITTKMPKVIKTRANTEATTLNNLESTTKLASKPKKFKKVNETKIESEIKLPQVSSLTINQEKPKPPKTEAYEYYYTYEEYSVDDDGKEIKDILKVKDENKKKVLKKTRRDNSNEYYAESISASHEDRKLNFKNDYDISI